MPRNIPGAMLTMLQGTYLTLALLVKVTRTDGVVKAFTTHDRDITYAAVVYKQSGSLSTSAVETSAGELVDNFEALGVISSGEITEDDLRKGLYNGADIEVRIIDYVTLTNVTPPVMKGRLGQVKIEDADFRSTFYGWQALLKNRVGELTSPLCRVKRLGDARCKVTLASFQFSRTVNAVASEFQMDLQTDVQATGYYEYGRIEFTSGDNDGIEREIKRHVAVAGAPNVARIVLQEPFPYPVQAGDACILEAGCDRRFETCTARFDNALNFRGEPHLPGTDFMQEVPRQGGSGGGVL